MARRAAASSRGTSLIDGLGHAWSGGDDSIRTTMRTAPDATALLGAFVRDAMQ